MVQHVLVPVDESDQSTQALEYGLEVFPEADITALHVLDPTELIGSAGLEGGGMTNYPELQEQREEEAEELLDEAEEIADDYGSEVTTETRTGPVAETIIDYADESGVDHIVIGSHGRTGASRVLLGSVAENVVRRSPFPVTVV